MGKGFCISPGDKGAYPTPSVIDARVEECEEGEFDQPTRTGSHRSGILCADSELYVIEKLCAFEEGTGRVGDCTTGQRSVVRVVRWGVDLRNTL